MNANQLFPPSEFLKSSDIDDAGGEMDLIISKVGIKEYEGEDGRKDRKGILEFSNSPLKLTTNATNTRTLIAMFGKETDDWIGKHIHLYVDEHVQFQGKETRGIRIRLVDKKQDAVTAYWSRARELGYSREDGLKNLQSHGGDFEAAVKTLQ